MDPKNDPRTKCDAERDDNPENSEAADFRALRHRSVQLI
jgi:hypothetical protein